MYDAGVAATAKAKEVNAKYDITGKLTAGAKTAYQKGAEFEKRNDVSRRVGGPSPAGSPRSRKPWGVHRGLAKDPAQRAQVTNHETRGRDELL